MQYPLARIIVFCKAPHPGKVKTRLARDIGELAATKVHEHLARHCLQQLSDFAIAPIELWCSPNTKHDFFRTCRTEYNIVLKRQVGNDLGQRMQHALSETLDQCSSAVLIGTDCPVISAEYLSLAFAAIDQNKTVIGPAEDGGYVLLGANTVQTQLFSDIPWGTSEVYAKTMGRITGEIERLPPLWDVDYVADLRRLRSTVKATDLNTQFTAYLDTLAML